MEHPGGSLAADAATTGAVVTRLRAAGCVFAEDEAAILLDSARSPAELEEMVARRVEGEPLEHVVGWAEFCGLRVLVAPGVFVPRVRTELLVREAVRLTASHALVVDLACGSGALGLAVLTAVPGVELVAADLDPVAVACARRNLEPLGATVLQGDLFAALPASLRGRVDVLLANVPYVPTAAIALLPGEARLHEPHLALDGGDDGLDVLRRVAAEAPAWLSPGGRLLVEVSERQVREALAIVASAALSGRTVVDEELEATVLVATAEGPA